MNFDPVYATWTPPGGPEWEAAAVVYWNENGAIGIRVALSVDGEQVAITSTSERLPGRVAIEDEGRCQFADVPHLDHRPFSERAPICWDCFNATLDASADEGGLVRKLGDALEAMPSRPCGAGEFDWQERRHEALTAYRYWAGTR